MRGFTRGRSEDRVFHDHILLLLAQRYPSIGTPSDARGYFAQRAGSRENLYTALDKTAKSYIDQAMYKEANTILASLADEIENPIVRAGHLLTIAEAALAMSDRDKAISSYREAANVLRAGPGPGGAEVRQRFELQLRETVVAFASEAAKLRDPKHVARAALLLKLYREAFPQRLAPVEPGSRDWNDAYAAPGAR